MEFKTKAVQQFKYFPKLSGSFAPFKFYNKFSADISKLRDLLLGKLKTFTFLEKIVP